MFDPLSDKQMSSSFAEDHNVMQTFDQFIHTKSIIVDYHVKHTVSHSLLHFHMDFQKRILQSPVVKLVSIKICQC